MNGTSISAQAISWMPVVVALYPELANCIEFLREGIKKVSLNCTRSVRNPSNRLIAKKIEVLDITIYMTVQMNDRTPLSLSCLLFGDSKPCE